ncbi:hypothetical protein K2P47_03330 [Patescibacteria group bacterium]|nr:hypothetical protein [Patescibacteria group bacterium]
MAFIFSGGKRYNLIPFDTEAEFEKAVIEHAVELFGPNTFYLDAKRLIARRGEWKGGIPDGFLIDLSDPTEPHLYFVENELASHDVYRHVAEQVARFLAIAVTDAIQLRAILANHIRANKELLAQIETHIKEAQFHNLDNLLNVLTEKPARVVVVIDEETEDLNQVLSVFQRRPDVAVLQRFTSDSESMYWCQPMRDDAEVLVTNGQTTAAPALREFDTIVCPAHKEGFESAFIKQDAWWAIRLSQEARERINYLAIYQKAPIGAVTHVAEIERIEPYKNSGKFIVYVKNKRTIGPIKLDGGGKRGIAPQGPRFTTIEKLKQAKKLSDLWK